MRHESIFGVYDLRTEGQRGVLDALSTQARIRHITMGVICF